MSTATLKRTARKAKSKKPATEQPKLSPGILHLWYAEERSLSDGRFFREYRSFSHRDREQFEKLLDLPREVHIPFPGPDCEDVVTIECQPPSHALLSISLRPHIHQGRLWPMVTTHVYHYGKSVEDARRWKTEEIEQSSYGAEMYLVVEVDQFGLPTKAEIDRIRPRIIEAAKAEILRAVKKEKARAKRDSARAKKAAATRKRNKTATA